MGVVVEKAEAVALARKLIVGEHRVFEPARFPDHRDGAVAHGQHLAEPAGLKARRHQENIGPGVHPVGEGRVHHKAGGHPAGVILLGPAEEVHIAGLPHAQAHELDILVHDVGDHIVHQVQALLVAQPCDHGHNGHVRPQSQAHLLLQGALAGGLARKVFGVVPGRNLVVGCGVILLHVNAVEDARQVVVARAQQAVQVFAVVGGLDFLRVGGADGGDFVRVDDAGLQVVGATEILQLVVREGAVRQAQHVLHVADAKHALIAEVVDGEHRADGVILGQALVLDAQQRRDHAGLPVMSVNHVRDEGNQREGV